jgi:hypothetical protein
MAKGPAGYGRYDDDPGHVGCPWAGSGTAADMVPCVARDGSLALSGGAERVCVHCGHTPWFLLRDLAAEYPPAAGPTQEARLSEDPGQLADRLKVLVRQATEPLAGGG